MKLICPLSGIEWKAEGFETGHRKIKLKHPIFLSDLRSLVARETDWQAGRLSEEEKILLFLATLHYSDLCLWHHPARPSIKIVEQNYLHLLKLVLWKDSVVSPRLALPRFSINKDTYTLENFHFWLQAWESAKAEWEAGIRIQQRNEMKSRLETYLEARIRAVVVGTQKETEKYLKVLAAWAELAADFPTFEILHPITKRPCSISDYWKEIICTTTNKLWQYPIQDIKELEDHLIDNLDDTSSLYAGALLRRVRKLISGQTTDLGLEIIEIREEETGRKKYEIVETISPAEQLSMQALIEKAPEQEPKEQDYPTKAAYLLARIAWKAKQRNR